MQRQLAMVIDELSAVLGTKVSLTPMQGGAINLSYSVKQGEQRFFLKLFDLRGADLLDRQLLFKQQKGLASKKLAPEPIYLSSQGDFQLDQWVEQKSLIQSCLTKTQRCKRLAQVLHRVHQTDFDLPKLDLPHDWQRYVSMGEIQLSKLQQKEHYALLAYWQDECEQLSVLCHNDLSWSHVPEHEEGIIFDWEYGACNSPYFDLASCCVVNQLNEGERLTLCKQYAKLAILNHQVVVAKVTKMLAVVKKTYGLWGQAYSYHVDSLPISREK